MIHKKNKIPSILGKEIEFEIRDIAFGGAGVGRVSDRQYSTNPSVECAPTNDPSSSNSACSSSSPLPSSVSHLPSTTAAALPPTSHLPPLTSILSGGRIVSSDIACFTKGVIDGETVKARVRRHKARLMEADLVEVLVASPHRVEPPCPYFLRCGGCSYQHITYSHQLEIKEKQLREALRRIGGIQEPLVKTIIPSPEPFHYRNRITVHVNGGAPGFFVERGHKVIEIDHCLIASEEVNKGLKNLKSKRPPDGDYLIGEKQHYGGFRQVNNAVASILLEEVGRCAGSGELLVDAYCGAGFFAHALRESFTKVIGIERSRGSIIMAREQAHPHEEFLEGGVEELLAEGLAGGSPSQTVLILDPPSEGISDLIVATILSSPPAKIVYISCNPATLARDIKRLSECYQLEESTPLDMFPQTAEIESVSLLKLS
ncbi:MAG TPA: hypothetical protein VJK54_05750 [Chthoniobacterales bacterium]|nr:hypothetical protein [Chthoniobacterales bacterium]